VRWYFTRSSEPYLLDNMAYLSIRVVAFSPFVDRGLIASSSTQLVLAV
jgi:hypothetical protein